MAKKPLQSSHLTLVPRLYPERPKRKSAPVKDLSLVGMALFLPLDTVANERTPVALQAIQQNGSGAKALAELAAYEPFGPLPARNMRNIPLERSSFTDVALLFASAFPDVPLHWLERRHVQELIALLTCVRYYFSDDRFVTLGEILQSPYANFVPAEFLPFPGDRLSKDSLFYNVDLISKTHLFYGSADLLTQVQEVVWVLLERLALTTQDIEIDLVLGSIHDWRQDNLLTTNLLAIPLRSIQFGADSVFHWNIKLEAEPRVRGSSQMVPSARFSLDPIATRDRTNFLVLKNAILDTEHQLLWFHPVSREVEGAERSRYYQPEENCANFTVEPGLGVRLNPIGADSIDTVFRSLILPTPGSFQYSAAAMESVGKPRYLPHDSVHPELHVDRDGRFLLVRNFGPANQYPFVTGFSDSTLMLLRDLGGGIAYHFNQAPKDLASRSFPKRDFDLKLLKHTGVCQLLFLEALSVRFTGKLLDGTATIKAAEVVRASTAKIFSLLNINAKYDPSDGPSPEPRLKDVFSKRVVDKLTEFVEKIFESAENFKTFLPDGQVVIEGFILDELRLVFAILQQAAISSRGETISKSRLDLFKHLCGTDSPNLRELQILSSQERPELKNDSNRLSSLRIPFVLKVSPSTPAGRIQQEMRAAFLSTITAFYPLTEFGFQIFLEGRPLEELGSQDFETKFALNEESQTAIPGSAGPINWFELHPQVFLHGKPLPKQEALNLLLDGMVEHNGVFYMIPAAKMPSMQKLAGFWERLQKGKRSGPGGFGKEELFYQVPKSEVLEMLALRSSGVSVSGGPRWQKICSFYDQLETPGRKFELPKNIMAELKPYQKIGVQRLYDLYNLSLGSILADDMGLGKTLQTLVFLEKIKQDKRVGKKPPSAPVLIVVPTSLTYNWLSEKEKFTPELTMMAFSPKEKDRVLDFLQGCGQPILLTTYGLMAEHKEFFQQSNWDVVIFDEAQNLKNIGSQRTTVARALSANVKVCLTGTPLENHLGELYSLVDLAVPGALGALDDFRKIYVYPPSILAEDIKYLKMKARPLILRRTKRELLDELPEKQESRTVLQFEDKQKKIYRDIAISYNQKIQAAIATDGEAKCQLQMFTALLRLRQACSDPGSLPNIKYEKLPPKIEALTEAVVEIVDSGESALVFTQFLHTLVRTEASLKAAGVAVFVLHGALSSSHRRAVLQEFNETEGGAVLLMTLKTGGVGLNLVKASYVFHLEPWWNPAVENQATDRVHRMGQTKSVQVYRYIMHESVEEKIELLKGRKEQRFNAMFSEVEDDKDLGGEQNSTASRGSALSKEDFEFLLQ